MSRVIVSRRIPQAGLDRLAEAGLSFDILAEDGNASRRALLDAVADAEGLLCVLGDQIDAALFDAAPNLRGVAVFAVGYNNVDLAEATRRGIAISNTPDVLTDATADLAWALILAAARRVGEGERLLRAGEFDGWAPEMLLGTDLLGKTLGIVGAGRIGTAVARRSRGWNMRVLYTDPDSHPDVERDLDARRVDLDTLCRESDFISVHVPLTEKTRHLFGAAQFAQMRPTALFINTARGAVHDEAALAAAIREGQIAGAGLDVYENEPAVHPDLLALDRVVLLPHIGSATRQTRDRMAVMAADNLIAMLAKKRPPNLVNTELLRD